MKPSTNPLAPIISAIVLLGVLLAGTFKGEAAQIPLGCSANNLNVNIGVYQNNVTNGTLVTWYVTVQNPLLPNGSSCAVTLGPDGLYFICPGPDGNPTGARTTLIPGGTTIQPGYGLETFEIPCLVNVNPGVLTAEGKVSAPGSVVHKNPIQDDPANVDKTISVNIFRPCINLRSQCNSAVNPGGSSVTVNYSGTVSNCGNIFLQNVYVYADQPAPNTLVLGPITLPANGTTNFSASYTRTDNLCGPFVTALTATGIAPTDIPSLVTSASTSQCTIGYSPAITVTKVCPPTPVQPGGVLVISGVVSNAGNIALRDVTVVNDKPTANTLLLGPITLEVGQSAVYTGNYIVPLDSCPPYTDTVRAQGTPTCGTQTVTSVATASCAGTNSPSIRVTQACPAAPVPPGGTLTYTGTVTNTGNVTLTNVIVVSDKPAANTRIFGPVNLAPGAGAAFSASYTVPVNSCGPYVDTIVATGRDKCFGKTVTDNSTIACPGTTTAGIKVTKACPASPVQPGGTLSYTGTVANTGNISLTNLTVYNGATLIYGPASLNPGASASFSASYVVPVDSCGPYVDTLFAQGQSLCGDPVQDSVTVPCPGANTPSIRVSKACPTSPVQPGQLLVYTGTVTNTGNITLTNVVVLNNKPDANTQVFGPVTLAPGQGAVFTGSYVVPLDSCGPYVDTLTATGADKCFGKVVTSAATASCPGANTPSIVVTKNCPDAPVPPGGTLTFTGSVVNTGNITLTNVIVVNDKPAANTRVFGPATLAPGQSASFTNSYTVPLNSCGPYTDTLTATGRDKCFGVTVTNTATAVCPGTTAPGIKVSKTCGAPAQPGGVLSYSGTVANTGNISLTNVVVMNGATVVYGPATLAAGTSANFTGSYTVPADSCPPYVDTLVATGVSLCGVTVQDTTTVPCPGANSPAIRVTRACPPAPVQPGGNLVYTGTVTNIGNITLTNVIVVAGQPAGNTQVFGPVTLAPGAGAAFSASYVVPLDSCGPYTDTVTASGADKCFGKVVTSSASSSCPGVNAPGIEITQQCPAAPTPIGGTLTYTATVVNTGNITLTNIVVENNRPATGTVVFRGLSLAPGESTNFTASYTVPANLNACSIENTLKVTGKNKCSGAPSTDDVTTICQVISAPGIRVVKICPTVPPQNGGLLTFNGTVSNTGNVTLKDVKVVVDRPAPGTVVFTADTLAPGQSAAFTGSYLTPADTCDVTDTLVATATDLCGNVVDNSTTTTCPLATTAGLAIARACPDAAVPPGAPLVFTGWITNTGNVTLRDVVVVVDRPAANTPVYGPVTLAPGQSAAFTGSFIVPTNWNACSITSLLTTRGNDKCTGAGVTASASGTCAVLTTPKILVTKACPPNPVPQGGTLVFTGTVANTGDITLTNIVVLNTVHGSSSISNVIAFRAVSLAPGQVTNFTGSYTAPVNCCTVTDTLTASGNDICTGAPVTDMASAICPVEYRPAVTITKVCPLVPSMPGETVTYTGMIKNVGDITLTDVVAYSSMLGEANPVLGIVALAPGEEVPYTATFVTPIDFCEPDSVTVEGISLCGGVRVTDRATSSCPVTTTPGIALSRTCPTAPILKGKPVTFTATVLNTGNVTLTNVTVVNSMPVLNTPVLGPIALRPGQSTNFTFTYIAPPDCNCCDLVDTLTVRAQDRCSGRSVAATATTVCPYEQHPLITVSLDCPAQAGGVGSVVNFSGMVMNLGDVTLSNVVVMGSGPAAGMRLVGPLTLARGETQDFTGSYTVASSTPPLSQLAVTATGNFPCTGMEVSAVDTCAGVGPVPPVLGPLTISGQNVTLTWSAVAGVTYRVQSRELIGTGTWQNEPGDVIAQSATASKTLALVAGQNSRYYRVMVVQ